MPDCIIAYFGDRTSARGTRARLHARADKCQTDKCQNRQVPGGQVPDRTSAREDKCQAMVLVLLALVKG